MSNLIQLTRKDASSIINICYFLKDFSWTEDLALFLFSMRLLQEVDQSRACHFLGCFISVYFCNSVLLMLS